MSSMLIFVFLIMLFVAVCMITLPVIKKETIKTPDLQLVRSLRSMIT